MLACSFCCKAFPVLPILVFFDTHTEELAPLASRGLSEAPHFSVWVPTVQSVSQIFVSPVCFWLVFIVKHAAYPRGPFHTYLWCKLVRTVHPVAFGTFFVPLPDDQVFSPPKRLLALGVAIPPVRIPPQITIYGSFPISPDSPKLKVYPARPMS